MNLNWKRLFRRSPSPPPPPFWASYLEQVSRAQSSRLPLEEVRFVVFDTETTGLQFKTDRILSIGAVEVQGGLIRTHQALDCVVQQPESYLSKEAIHIHGILPGASRQGVREEEALPAFLEFAGNAVLAGHHVAFDLAILREALRRHGCGRLKNPTLDTRTLAIRLEKGRGATDSDAGRYSLDALCERYDIPDSDRHTAAGDAYITAILLLKLLARLRKRGVKTLGDLVQHKPFFH
jgi:DNA polymerase-3 subunit epsilon